MKMQDRLAAMIQNAQVEIEELDKRIAEDERRLEGLRARRLLIEEEAVEARVTLNFLQFHHVKVERNDEGVLVSSADPVEESS